MSGLSFPWDVGVGGQRMAVPLTIAPLSTTPCTACHLHKHSPHAGIGYSWLHKMEGDDRPILFVGGAPGPQEAQYGAPFIGKSGQFLWEQIAKVGIPKNLVALSNIVQCIPLEDTLDLSSFREPTQLEVACCHTRLLREIHALNPSLIVPLGASVGTFFSLFGIKKFSTKRGSVTDQRGQLYEVKLGDRTYRVFSTYHPSGVLRNKIFEHLFQCDLGNVRAIFDGRFGKVPEVRPLTTTSMALRLFDKCQYLYENREETGIRHIAIDFETIGLDPLVPDTFVVGMALSYGGDSAFYIPFRPCGPDNDRFVPDIDLDVVVGRLRELLAVVPVSNQHMQFEYKWFAQDLDIVPAFVFGDPLIGAKLLYGEQRKGQNRLDQLARDFKHVHQYDADLEKYKTENGITGDYSKIPFRLISQYAGVDAWVAWHLLEHFINQIGSVPEFGLFETPYRLSMGSIPAFSEIELAGQYIDKAKHAELKNYYSVKDRDLLESVFTIPALLGYFKSKGFDGEPHQFLSENKAFTDDQLCEKFGFNPRSPAQVAEVLFDYFHYPFNEDWRSDGGGRSTDESVLNAIKKACKFKRKKINKENPPPPTQVEVFIDKIFEIRSNSKLLSTYVVGMEPYLRSDGTLQVKYNIDGAATGRASAEKFGLHQMPKPKEFRLRELMVSRFERPYSEFVSDFSDLQKAFKGHWSRKWLNNYPASGGGLYASFDFCLTGDTKIITENGVLPMSKVVATRPGLLSCSVEGELSMQKVTASASMGVKPIVKITFDDGSSVRCTKEHKWMLFDGTFCKTEDLQVGSRLRHVKSSYNGPNRYPTWYVGSNRNYVLAHQVVASYAYGPVPEGMEVDHIDGDPENWRRDNLRYLSVGENRGQGGIRWWENATEEQRKQRLEALIAGGVGRDRTGTKNPNYGNLKGESKLCLFCKQEFYASPSRNQVYCDLECRTNDRFEKRSFEHTCLVCGKVKKIYPSAVKRGRSFCSAVCDNTTLSCKCCGLGFKAASGVVGGYCSVDCGSGVVAAVNHRVVSIEYAGEEEVFQITIPPNFTYVLENGLVSKNSQLELRVLASASGDPGLLESFERGYDLHKFVASRVFYPSHEKLLVLSETEAQRLVLRLKTSKTLRDLWFIRSKETPFEAMLQDPALFMGFLPHIDKDNYQKVAYDAVTKDERGLAKCVHPDTLVWGSSGPCSIQSVSSFSATEGEFLDCSFDIVGSENKFTTAIKTYNGGLKNLVHVVSRRGVLTCSKEHKILLENGSLVKAKNLRPGDVVRTVSLPNLESHDYPTLKFRVSKDTPPINYTPDNDTSYFAGMFLGDGCALKDKSVRICHGDVSKIDKVGLPYIEWQNLICDSLLKVGFSVSPNVDYVYFGSRVVWRFLQKLGLVARDKGKILRVPKWVLSAGRESILFFLGGLIDTDGCVASKSVSITTKDAVFAGQIASLWAACGCVVSMDPSFNPTYRKWYYRIRLSAHDTKIMIPYMRHPAKIGRICLYPKRVNVHPNKVLHVISAGVGPCVDVEVSNTDHLYVANTFLTHNTISFGIVYGSEAESIAEKAVGMSVEEAKGFIDEYFRLFPRVSSWIAETHAIALATGTCKSLTHRTRYVFDALSSKRSVMKEGLRAAQNMPIQSSASDITLRSLQFMREELRIRGLKSLIVGTVHDSICWDIYPGEFWTIYEMSKEIMENRVAAQPEFQWIRCKTEADAEVGRSWGQLVNIKEFHPTGGKFAGHPLDMDSFLRSLSISHPINISSRKEEDTKDGPVSTVVLEMGPAREVRLARR